MVLEIQELKKHRELSKQIISNCDFCVQKLEKQCQTLAEKLNNTELNLQKTENEVELNTMFAETEHLRDSILSLLIIKEKFKIMINKNKARLSEIEKQIALDDDGTEPSLKSAEELLNSTNLEINVENLGLSAKSCQLKFFNGTLFKVQNGMLDMSQKENIDALQNLNFENLEKVISVFPGIVSNFQESQLLDSGFRLKLLKAIANFAFEESKQKTIIEINSAFGELLNFKYKIANTTIEYIREVDNLFKVKIRRYLISKNQTQTELISKKLVCNTGSQFLPEKYYEKSESPKNKELDIDAEIEEFLKSLSEDNK